MNLEKFLEGKEIKNRGEIFELLRKNKNWSRKKAVDEFNNNYERKISFMTLYRIERKMSIRPQMKTLKLLLKLYDVDENEYYKFLSDNKLSFFTE